jgi:LacI family transcriptional regulator
MRASETRLGKQPTIKDIAKLAGVSFKTVSRVLNGEGGVKPDKRAAVLQAADMLKYAPNVAARQLAGNESFLVALLYDIPSHFLLSIQWGATQRCRELGFHLIVEELGDGAVRETLQRLQSLRVSRVMLGPSLFSRPGLIAGLREAGFRYVLLAPDEFAPDNTIIRADDEQAAFELVSRLIAMGHREIAFIGGPGRPHSELRRKGWMRALQTAGITFRPELEGFGDYLAASGEAAADALLRVRPRPTAIFAANDFMALGVLMGAARNGLRVPADLSVAGFDDAIYAGAVSPGLTTVRLPLRTMGSVAVDLLTDRNPPAEPTHATLGHEIVERDSTAPPPQAPAALGQPEAPAKNRRPR